MDEYVSNKQRARIANRSQAKMLLRLHLDASPSPGFASYFPDKKGRSEGVFGPSLRVISASSAIAEHFHSSAMQVLRGSLADKGVHPDSETAVGAKQGALTGSIFSEVPVVLVEMAVLTVPNDERFIASSEGQAKMALALHCGVDAAVRKLRTWRYEE